MTATAINTVLNAADTQFSSIVNSTTDHNARNQQMAAWLKTRPEFADSGVTPSADSVWGRLKNGHLYVATSSFIPGETRAATTGRSATSAPVSTVSPTKRSVLPAGGNSKETPRALSTRSAGVTRDAGDNELPPAPQARVLLSLDKDFFNPPNDKIAGMLRDHNYTVLQQMATIENLKTVQGDGAFYWGTHGAIGVDRTQKAYWTAWTATDRTDANNDTYKADLDDGSLVYFSAAYRQVNGVLQIKTRYGITTKFIAKYNWSFAANAFIFMNCCYSRIAQMTTDIGGRVNGSVVTYGWDNSVLVSSAWTAGVFAFDRQLGVNQTEPLESVPQRPFDAVEVFFEMQERGLDNGGDTCRLISQSAGTVALSPSIMNMEMSERIQESPLKGKSKLTLHGIFGSDKGTVKIGGVEVPIDSWKVDTIECEPADLPGPGFAGDVVVTSHDRPSNAVPLTQWHGKLIYDIDILPSQVSSAHSNITCDVYFRGDVHPYRKLAGRAVVDPNVLNFRASQGSTAHWQVSGDPVPMAVWSGPLSADLPFGLNGTVNTPYGTGYIVSGAIDMKGGSAKFSFSFLNCVTAYSIPGAPVPPQEVATLRDPLLTSQGSGVGSDGYVIYSNNVAATIGSDDYVIPGLTLTGSTPIFNPKLKLTDFIPTYQPDKSKGEDNAH